jgi:hypothetical protein
MRNLSERRTPARVPEWAGLAYGPALSGQREPTVLPASGDNALARADVKGNCCSHQVRIGQARAASLLVIAGVVFRGRHPGVATREPDTVASAIAPYRDAAASEVAQRLDTEVLDLLRQVTGVPASAAP